MDTSNTLPRKRFPSRTAIRSTLILLLTAIPLGHGFAQGSGPSDTTVQHEKEKKWDITASHGPTTDVSFSTDEGTWMAVDVSPDGKQIVFDLLGDLYIMPMTGDTARQLTSGPAYDVQPRFSPDGKRISFTSDRDGIDNLWVLGLDSLDLKQITKEKERQVNNAVWTPDGLALIGRKHYRNTRSLGAGEMWLYHVGGGTGLQLTDRRNWQQDAGEPAVSPDGRYVYWSEDVTPGGMFQYNKDPYGVIYAVQRLDRQTGKVDRYISGAGGSARPQPSPDGRSIAFVRRVGYTTALFIYDIDSGRETLMYDGLSRDQQEAWAIFGVYPGFAWTPDSKSLVFWAKGKIHKLTIASGKVSVIPFVASVQQTVTDAVRFPQDVSPESFDVRMLRWVTVSPNGRSVVYAALGKLYTRTLPDGTPRRLTDDERNLEMYPSFSSDGEWITYTTWNDDDLGAVWKIRASGRSRSKLTTAKGTYEYPSFSPDGRSVVFARTGGDILRGRLYSRDQGIYIMPSSGGKTRLVTEEGSQPRFSADGNRLYLVSSEKDDRALVSVGLFGEERRVHVLSENAQEMSLSPDEQWLGLVERYQVYLAPLPKTGRPIKVGPGTKDMPFAKLTRDAGTYLSWTGDSRTLYWSLGPDLYSRDLGRTFGFVPDAGTLEEGPDTVGTPIGFRQPTDVPGTTLALTGGTVISMNGDEIIPNATVIVDRNRIAKVGPASAVTVPKGARSIDVSGTFLIPGIIDVHAHGNFGDWSPVTNWRYYANLAFGVTTMHDPSASTDMVFTNSEMIKAGRMVGPRLYSTGTILYGAEGSYKAIVNSYDDALAHLRRLKAVGAFTVKSYNQPRRDQRQQIIRAARDLDMMVVPEGGSTFFWNMTMVLDGHTTIEHNIPISPIYRDVRELIARSQTALTPTLIVHYSGLSGEYYWYQNTRVWENDRLMAFTPREVVEPRARRRQMAEEDDYSYKITSAALKEITDRGGKVLLGAHGQLQGLGAHWELWMLQQGGMTPHEALRSATLYGAEALGLDKDLGSIEPGKLADIAVLDKDPLANIRNSEFVRYVMVNGRLYDASTMDEIGEAPRKRPAFWWER